MKFVNINDHPNRDEIIEIRDEAIEEFEDQTRDYRLAGMNFSISCNDYLTPTGLEFNLNFELDNETDWIKRKPSQTHYRLLFQCSSGNQTIKSSHLR